VRYFDPAYDRSGSIASNDNVCDVRSSPNCCRDAAVPRSVWAVHPVLRPIRARARARVMGFYSGGIVPSAGAERRHFSEAKARRLAREIVPELERAGIYRGTPQVKPVGGGFFAGSFTWTSSRT
jgi:hypothetical protein